jgi:hypothetical protein
MIQAKTANEIVKIIILTKIFSLSGHIFLKIYCGAKKPRSSGKNTTLKNPVMVNNKIPRGLLDS